MKIRPIAKMAAKIVVGTVVQHLTSKTLLANFPSTANYKIAGMTGALVGWQASEMLEPYTDKIVDDIADAHELRKIRK